MLCLAALRQKMRSNCDWWRLFRKITQSTFTKTNQFVHKSIQIINLKNSFYQPAKRAQTYPNRFLWPQQVDSTYPTYVPRI